MPGKPVGISKDPLAGTRKGFTSGKHTPGLGVGNVVSGTASGLYKGITGFPTGAYMVGRSIGHDIAKEAPKILSGDLVSPTIDAATGKLRTEKLAAAIGKSEYNQYRYFGKGGDLSGPILDALALLTSGAGTGARVAKAVSEVSDVATAARAAKAADLATKDAATFMAKGGGGVKGIGYDKAAERFGLTSRELKIHARQHSQGLSEGNMSIGKPAGQQGKYANVPPHEVLKDPNHPLFDFYAQRNPDQIGNFTRARKAFMTKPQYSRPMLKGKPFAKQRTGFYVPTSPNPVFRQIRKGIEQVRPESGYFSSARELKKEAVRREITQERLFAPKNIRVAARNTAPAHQSPLAKVLSAPMGALRTGMWLRPRYYLQNIGQTGQMLATEPVLSAKSANLARHIRGVDPHLYNQVRAITGDAQAGALAQGTAPGRIANLLGNRIPGKVGATIRERGVQGTMGNAANIPESHVRMLSVLNELQKYHRAQGNLSVLTPEHVSRYIENVRRQGVISREHLPFRRSVENVGDFSRIYSKNMLRQRGWSEKEFMATHWPIFYPMFKALTRYGVRMPSEHPINFAATVATGKVGKKEQKRLLGPLPFWAQYLVPKGAGDPNAKRGPREAVFNPANIYNLQPGADIGRQAAEVVRTGGPRPGLSFLQEAGPAPGLAVGIATGHDLQTGYPIKPFSKATYKHHPWLNKSIINAPVDFVEGLPLSSLELLASGQKPHVRSFAPGGLKGTLLNEMIGPAFVPRTLKTKETAKQAKREGSYGMGRQPRKKREYYP